MLIISRIELYQYIIWYVSLCVGDCLVCRSLRTDIPGSHLSAYLTRILTFEIRADRILQNYMIVTQLVDEHITFSFPASSDNNTTKALDASLLSKQSKPPLGPSKFPTEQIGGTLVLVVKWPVRESENLSLERMQLFLHPTISCIVSTGTTFRSTFFSHVFGARIA